MADELFCKLALVGEEELLFLREVGDGEALQGQKEADVQQHPLGSFAVDLSAKREVVRAAVINTVDDTGIFEQGQDA